MADDSVGHRPDLGGLDVRRCDSIAGTLQSECNAWPSPVDIAINAMYTRTALSDQLVARTHAPVKVGYIMGSGDDGPRILEQLGVNVNFLIQLTTVTAAAVFGGIALVFALGTRQHLANLIGAHYARKHYAPGDHVRIGAFEGRVLEISDGCVFIETEQGDVSVPGEHFTQQPFVKLRKSP